MRGFLPYPRSFLGLLLAGFSLVALPLVGALAYSAWNTTPGTPATITYGFRQTVPTSYSVTGASNSTVQIPHVFESTQNYKATNGGSPSGTTASALSRGLRSLFS